MFFSLATGTLRRMWVTIFISDSVGNSWWRFQDKDSPWFCKSHPDQLAPPDSLKREWELWESSTSLLLPWVILMTALRGGQGWRPAENSPTAKLHALYKPYIFILLIVSFEFSFVLICPVLFIIWNHSFSKNAIITHKMGCTSKDNNWTWYQGVVPRGTWSLLSWELS